MMISSLALSLVLLFTISGVVWSFIIYENFGSMQVYCEWNKKMIEILYTFSFLLLFMCFSSLLWILILLYFEVFVSPSTSGMYFANLCVTVPTHLVIHWPLGEASWDLKRQNLIGSVRNGLVWNRYWYCFEIFGGRESKCSNTIGNSTPVHIGLFLRHTLPFFCQTKCLMLACK